MPKKLLIGIDDTCRCNVLGSLVMSMVVADRFFFRKWAHLCIRDSKTCTKSHRDEIFERLRDKVHYWKLVYIKPTQMLNRNLNDLEAEAIINLLNSYPKFWEHEIFIDNCDKTRERFIDRLKKYMPENLAKIEDKLKMDKWKIEHFADVKYRIVSLASIFAKYWSDKEYEEMKAIWGNIGSGQPNDLQTLKFLYDNLDDPAPIIRTKWITFTRLGEKEEKEKLKLRLQEAGLLPQSL